MVNISVIKEKFLRGIFNQNTYVVSGKNDAIIIDAGAELEDVEAEVKNKNVKAILITHIHFDHIWNLEKYVGRFNCPVYVVCDAEEKFADKDKNASTLMRQNIVQNIDKSNIKYYAEKLELGEIIAQIFKTPGHSSDSVCILIEDNLFCGDTLFDDSVGRTDLYDSSSEELIQSLKLIKSLEFKTAYPGHYGSVNKAETNKTIDFYI